jgi:hypothetical protein
MLDGDRSVAGPGRAGTGAAHTAVDAAFDELLASPLDQTILIIRIVYRMVLFMAASIYLFVTLFGDRCYLH